jgi:hypothetical protein
MKNRTWLVGIFLLAVINIFLFWPGNLYFLNDDLLHIPLTDQGHFFQTNSVRPLHELLIKLDLFLWSKNAYGYHITALILHIIVCTQLYELCVAIQKHWLIERRQASLAALLAVSLFLAYPQSSESLAWILGRAPILSAMFVLVTVRLFFIENYKLSIYLAGAFFFAASLFTYEQTLFLPLWLFLIAFLEKEKEKRTNLFSYAAILLVVAAGYLIVRKLMTSEVIGAYEGGNLLSMNWVNLTANAFRFFFRLVLNPALKQGFVINVLILLFFLGVLTFFIKKATLNTKALIFFSSIVVLLIAPVISLGLAVNSFESGRYLYLPSIFFVYGISIVGFDTFYKNPRSRKLLLMILILLTAYWLIGKYKAAKYYTDASLYSKQIEQKIQRHFKISSDTLFLDTLRVTVHRLPVFRRGFKTGINWFNDNIDTNKVVARYLDDEVLSRSQR